MAGKELDLAQVGILVDRKIRTAVGVATSKLAKEREKVTRYYNGELPKQQHAGSSSYVSTDVYDAVEAMKADLLETFGGGQEIVKFTPQGAEDVEPCRIATEYASYVIYRQNCGFHIFHDVLDDGLKARIGVVKVYWEDKKEYEDEEFDDLDEPTVQSLAGQDDVDELEANLNEDGMTYSGSLTRVKTDSSQVRIENVAPEEFGIEPQAKKLDGYFHYQRMLLTKAEMKEQGIDTKKLKDVNPDADENSSSDEETQARFNQIDTGYQPNSEEDQEELKRYVVYECYTELAKPGSRPCLYKVIQVAKIVLSCEEVDRSPFKVFVPLRTAHNFWGNSFAARVVPYQNARTVLTRGILDHTAVTNNPRYTVLQGGLTNPREMLDNRLGGIVNISRPDAVAPLQQASLNPFVFQTLETLKQNKEETTGTSSLAQGLNKDAISNQNSGQMINDLVDLSKQRAKVIARNFAHFLQELYIEVYRLVIENESRQSVVEVAGNWVEIDPRTWIERKDASISLFLGAAAADTEAMKFASLMTMGAQDQSLDRLIGEEGKYAAAVHIMRLKGIKNVSDFIKSPEERGPPAPDPMQQLAVEQLKLEKAQLEANVQIAQLKLQVEQEKSQALIAKHQAEMANIQLENMLKLAENHRKDMQVANEIDVSQRELEIAESAPSIEPAKAIVSPNS